MRAGRPFYKMSGSGNDFVFFDTRDGPSTDLESPSAVESLCARGTGIGADGVVFFDPSDPEGPAIRYYNSDGSVGELCGNATLCAVRLNQIIGGVTTGDLLIRTDAGGIAARIVDGLPEIDLEPVKEVEVDYRAIPPVGSEKRIGYALAGVPHIVIEVPSVESIDVLGRGSEVRRHRSLAMGANVNFVAPEKDGRWLIRTYERGVEGETLACGTGAVAASILLAGWGRSDSPVRLLTRSGLELSVRLRRDGDHWRPSLRGNAELVFTGQLPVD